MNSIRAEGLSFAYTSGEPVLYEISLTLDSRSTAIIGQNGAGKTTFVKLLKGLLRPTAGAVFWNDVDISTRTVAQIAKHIGLVFQNPNDQIFKSRVLDEVLFGPLNIGMTEQEALSHVQSALAAAGLSGREDENPYDMGLSERKMVAVASILAMDTPVVIFDEPTIAQDWAGRQQIKSIIRGLREQGKTVLTIIHDMDFVAECFERVIVFSHGRVLLDGSADEVFAREDVLRAANLELPHITRLCRELGIEKTLLTPEEFAKFYRMSRPD